MALRPSVGRCLAYLRLPIRLRMRRCLRDRRDLCPASWRRDTPGNISGTTERGQADADASARRNPGAVGGAGAAGMEGSGGGGITRDGWKKRHISVFVQPRRECGRSGVRADIAAEALNAREIVTEKRGKPRENNSRCRRKFSRRQCSKTDGRCFRGHQNYAASKSSSGWTSSLPLVRLASKYVRMNGSMSPSSTRSTSPTPNLVRWSLIRR